ncbi:TRAP transporter permease [Ammoniphilus sp. YIM 78166]|uniref:TRAP transporter permease n=1 Tax=Ammoniphilus sp. YIM 78166 TaxID=1644106 RepID=UPI0014317C79|nr:TRAP transporter permease [Ammoniphilus sp. YIM 78166]
MKNPDLISSELQEEVSKKYDTESTFRNPAGILAAVILALSLAMAVFHLYTAGFGLLETIRQRAVHLMFVLALVFLLYPARRKSKTNRVTWMDMLLAMLSIISVGYVVFQYKDILMRGGMPNQVDIFMGSLAIVLVLEAVRRAVGKELAIIAMVFLAYAYYGPYMPGIFAHSGASFKRLIDHLFMIPEGLFSIALGTSATYIVLFIIFGTFLERSGLGLLIQDLALALAGKTIGGPAKVSVMTSALFGSISGSAAANVVTTGAFTIPLMKRIGYSREFSGAVEASASTAGQLMPPIMGSAAFIMADYLGIPYSTIILAAVIPVALYYTGVFTMVHLRARKLGLRGLSAQELPLIKEALKERGHLLLPFLAVIVLLMMQYTPLFVGFWGIILTVLVSALRKNTRMSIQDIRWALETGAKRTVPVAIATASVGLVIGVSTLTGVASALGNYILHFSQGSLLLTLILVMLISILMGMGLPTVATYVLLATVAAPVIAKFDVPLLAAHFFVFYFGLMANVTPPVAIPAYAAAGLSGGSPSQTGWEALKLTLPAFIVPYMFVYSPQILFVDYTWIGVISIGLSAMTGVIILSCVIENYLVAPLSKWQRVVMLTAGLCMIKPGLLTDTFGITVLLFIYFLQRFELNKKAAVDIYQE